MKREIKFRIWDGSKMEYSVLAGAMGVVYVNPANGGVNPRDTACITPFNTIYPDGIEVMQYTGILDKNGREIYEGDICTHKFFGEIVVVWSEEDACFACNTLDDVIKDELSYCLADIETVIGNIHNNPKLLK